MSSLHHSYYNCEENNPSNPNNPNQKNKSLKIKIFTYREEGVLPSRVLYMCLFTAIDIGTEHFKHCKTLDQWKQIRF